MRSKLILAFVTTLLSVLMLESAARWLFRSPYQWERRLMFFSEGHNLRNADWGGFTYQPHENVHAVTYYLTSLDSSEVRAEYDYRFTTNGDGLVQRRELLDSKPAILFLGDSFTEGQGAQPWFYSLEHDWPQSSAYQIVNGGFFGTGVETWGRLYRSLSTRLKIPKVVIIFISDDWTRFVWKFSPKALQCLKTGAQCTGAEDYYGLPEDPSQAQAVVSRIAQYRTDYLANLRNRTNVISRSALSKNFATPMLEALTRFRRTGSFESRESRQFEISKRVASNIVSELGRENVLFLYLPQKDELDRGPKSPGRNAIDFILQSGFAFVDGRATCGLLLQDYFERDGHPNARGYAKIAACVRSALDVTFRP